MFRAMAQLSINCPRDTIMLFLENGFEIHLIGKTSKEIKQSADLSFESAEECYLLCVANLEKFPNFDFFTKISNDPQILFHIEKTS